MRRRLDLGLAIDASAAVSDDTVINDTNIFYLNFYTDLSSAFMTAELVKSPRSLSENPQELFAKRLAGEVYFWLSYGLFY